MSDCFATPWTVACKAPLPKGFPRQEYRNGLPFLPPGESSWSRGQTHVSCGSCTAGRFFTTAPCVLVFFHKGLPGGSVVKNPASVGDASSVPEPGRSPGEGYWVQCRIIEKFEDDIIFLFSLVQLSGCFQTVHPGTGISAVILCKGLNKTLEAIAHYFGKKSIFCNFEFFWNLNF